LISAAAGLAAGLRAAETPRTGSRARFTHRVSLYDESRETIDPKEPSETGPYSPVGTCGKCHDYDAVGNGRHYNAVDPEAPPGRPGEPWILTDKAARTQIPLSYRKWEGTFRPGDAGLSPWEFVQKFGHHMPGGGPGEKLADGDKDPNARWGVSGKLTIDCLTCHNATPEHDQTQWGSLIKQQNYKWAHVAVSGLGVVRGSAMRLPDDFDPEMPEPGSEDLVPEIVYDQSRFDSDGRVLFNVQKKPDPRRCYFCHTVRRADVEPVDDWKTDGDVHLASGMGCSDCHANGISHNIVRGYEGESADLERASLTCRGCHLGDANQGRFGAPRPRHAGLPGLHLDKLSCTACHSGPKPEAQTIPVQTAMAHNLGPSSLHRGNDDPPRIVQPVFIRNADGKIAPHRMMWPAFWGVMTGSGIQPIPPAKVAKAAGSILKVAASEEGGEKKAAGLAKETVDKVLEALAETAGEGTAVYVSGGCVYSAGGKAGGEAKPYAWAMAHDVRPAQQSLGAGGCADCHEKNSAFFHGTVTADASPAADKPASTAMSAFQGVDGELMNCWAPALKLRPVFTAVMLGSLAVMGITVLHNLCLAIAGALKGFETCPFCADESEKE